MFTLVQSLQYLKDIGGIKPTLYVYVYVARDISGLVVFKLCNWILDSQLCGIVFKSTSPQHMGYTFS